MVSLFLVSCHCLVSQPMGLLFFVSTALWFSLWVLCFLVSTALWFSLWGFCFLVSFWCLVVQPVGLLLFVSTHCLANHQVTLVTFFWNQLCAQKGGGPEVCLLQRQSWLLGMLKT
jgi:hypothetical protein